MPPGRHAMATPAATDPLANVRDAFPALAREVNGKPVAYLDSGASAQRVLASIQAVDRYERRHHSNVHRGSHTLSAEATAAYEGARATVADHIGAADRREVIFVRNATEAINLVARAWGDANVGAGDRIVLTEMEHHSNIVPWQQLAARQDAEIDWVGRHRRGRARHGRAARRSRARPQGRRRHARLERARHAQPARRDLAARARGRRDRRRRRRPGGSEAGGRHGRAGCRLLRDDGPQGVRAHRDRRPLGPPRPPARDGAVPRRRLDDPQGDHGGHDVGGRSRPLRGRHPRDRAGDRASGGAPLARRHRHGARDGPRARDHRLRDGAPRSGRRPHDLRSARRAPSASARSPSNSTASTPTTSQRSWTATASRCAQVITVPSR